VFTSLRAATPTLVSRLAFLNRPVSLEEATSSSRSFLRFSKELLNYYKILFLGRQEDNLLPFKKIKKKRCAAVRPGSQDSKHRGQCGLSCHRTERKLLFFTCAKKDKCKHKKLRTSNCLGQTCDGKHEIVVSGFGD